MNLPDAPRALAVVVGAGGGIGAALLSQLETRAGHDVVLGLGRASQPALDMLDEASIASAAAHVARLGVPLRVPAWPGHAAREELAAA